MSNASSLDPVPLLAIMADVLRLPEECVAMSFVYMNRARKFYNNNAQHHPPDEHMLVLACLSLASKATEAPRRLREFLLPAWRLANPSRPPLRLSSDAYDRFRSALVRSELILLRLLKFELRIPLPFDFLATYLGAAMSQFTADCADDLDANDPERREATRVVGVMDTAIAGACRLKAMAACKDYQLANFFPARTIAAASIYSVMQARGLLSGVDAGAWLRENVSRTVEIEDFEEAVSRLNNI